MSKKEDKKLKDAVWQYLIDHASIADDNMYRIQFHVHTENDFWQRVRSRKNGTYMRKDQLEFEERARKLRERRERNSMKLKHRRQYVNRLMHGTLDEKLKGRIILQIESILDELCKPRKKE